MYYFIKFPKILRVLKHTISLVFFFFNFQNLRSRDLFSNHTTRGAQLQIGIGPERRRPTRAIGVVRGGSRGLKPLATFFGVPRFNVGFPFMLCDFPDAIRERPRATHGPRVAVRRGGRCQLNVRVRPERYRPTVHFIVLPLRTRSRCSVPSLGGLRLLLFPRDDVAGRGHGIPRASAP